MTEDNPCLPDGRQYVWNHSTLEPAKACARKYHLSVHYEMDEDGWWWGWVPKTHSDDITFGSHYAKALERYHSGILRYSHQDALREVVRLALEETAEWRSEHNFKNRETLVRSIIWYLDQFQDDPCETVVLATGRPAVELSFSFQLDDEIVLAGHMDRIVQYAGDVYVQDQKTTGASIGAWYFKRFNPNDQMSLYSIAAEVVWKTPVKGVMIDAAQIAVGFTRFERGFTFRTPAQTEKWLQDARYFIERTWEAEAKDWPLNDAACMLYGGCPFIDVCSRDPSVQREFLETRYVKRRVSPLEIR
jgi:Tfp pilus assembly protein PilZ